MAGAVIYKTMILPYFDYGDLVYDADSRSELQKLQRLQMTTYELQNNAGLPPAGEELFINYVSCTVGRIYTGSC